MLTSRAGACGFFGSSLNQHAAAPRRACPVAFSVSAMHKGPNIGGGKKWEHYELTKNGKPVRIKMHVRKEDTVVVIAGADKGKVGKVVKVLPKRGEVIIEGVNNKIKNIKPKTANEQGKQENFDSPVHHSNVMHWSPAQQVRSRVGHKEADGKKVRYLVKTGEIIG